MANNCIDRTMMKLPFENQCGRIEVLVPWPLAIHKSMGPERFCWIIPGQERAWDLGKLVWGVFFIGNEILGFSVFARYYNDAIALKHLDCSICPEDVRVIAKRVVPNVRDGDCVQQAFNEIVSSIRARRERRHGLTC
jgi:hypothetical protein